MTDFIVKINLPSPVDFVTLRQDTDWGVITRNQATKALVQSSCGVTAYDGNTVIGMARVIGDAVLNLFIQDVIVARPYRGKGVGEEIMQTLIAHLKQNYPADCTVGLMAAKGQSGFYEHFGFENRPSDKTDAGMTASLGHLNCTSQKTVERLQRDKTTRA